MGLTARASGIVIRYTNESVCICVNLCPIAVARKARKAGKARKGEDKHLRCDGEEICVNLCPASYSERFTARCAGGAEFAEGIELFDLP